MVLYIELLVEKKMLSFLTFGWVIHQSRKSPLVWIESKKRWWRPICTVCEVRCVQVCKQRNKVTCLAPFLV